MLLLPTFRESEAVVVEEAEAAAEVKADADLEAGQVPMTGTIASEVVEVAVVMEVKCAEEV